MARAFDQIDQFVVVMMENRSFDHMLGYWGLPPWSGDRAAQPADGVRLDHVCPAPDGSPRVPFAFTSDELGLIDHDLPHDRRSWGRSWSMSPSSSAVNANGWRGLPSGAGQT
ncbi:MAG TPA: alkaline phosphatase family protein, partial [Polyangia bacterium]